MTRIFLVDCEAYGNTPVKGTLTEFGAVDLATDGSFYGRLWLSDPDPDIPAIPIPRSADGPVPLVEIDSIDGSRAEVLADIDAVFVRFAAWVADLSGSDQPVFVSDNPAYDWMWVAAGFDTANLDNPFGYSARRIGDFAAGLHSSWKNSSGWKALRVTEHDHHPVNDCLGNAEALRVLLARASD